MKKILSRWLPVAVWMVVIYYFSSRADLPSNRIDWLDFVIKKSAHVAEYAILTFLSFRAFGRSTPDYAILLSIFYAFTDETHQFFTPGRGPKLSDIMIDSVGITIMSYLIVKKYEAIRHPLKRRH